MTDKEKIEKLARRLHWLLGHAKFGGGYVSDREGNMIAPSIVDVICDEVEACAGWKIDRDEAHALQLPRRERDRFFKNRRAQVDGVDPR